MNIWKFSSRWSETGAWHTSILDIFCKHGIAFIYDDNNRLNRIIPQSESTEAENGDLIAISDGHQIVAVGKALTKAMPVKDLQGVHLSDTDLEKLSGTLDNIVGLKARLYDLSVLPSDEKIWYPVRSRFCQVKDPEIFEKLQNAYEAVSSAAFSQKFEIAAAAKTLGDLLQDGKTRLYMIPIFQRPYAWGELEVERFMNDIFRAYVKDEPMFIGTLQFSGERLLHFREQTKYREIIDGQQRLTTCALILKALLQLDPENAYLIRTARNFDWIESRVSNGEQQRMLDATLHAKTICETSSNGLNRYWSNCLQILKFIREWKPLDVDSGDSPKSFSVDAFAHHLVEQLKFVVIETQAGLSQTLQIFNTINTAGLDLNGGDLFKVRAFEYLTDHAGQPQSCFDQISQLYGKIDQGNNQASMAVTSINEILGIYQKILIGRHQLRRDLTRIGTETFFDRLFDTRLGIKNWDAFGNIRLLDSKNVLIQLSELETLIDNRFELERRCVTTETSILDWETRLAFHVIAWSRYSSYWTLYHVAEFCYPEDFSKRGINSFIQSLARLFFVFSIIYGKQIYEIHSFIAEITADMFGGNTSEATPGRLTLSAISKKINEKIHSRSDGFIEALEGDFAAYSVAKNLTCRVVECLQPDKVSIEDLNHVFKRGYDIEHIQSYNDEIVTERDRIWKEWGIKINGLGNLMLLERDINRSIGNKNFTEKVAAYMNSKFKVVRKVAEKLKLDPSGDVRWELNDANDKLKKDKELLINYAMPSTLKDS